MALTIDDLANWLNANEAAPIILGATPSSVELDILQRCLDAAKSLVVSHYQVPADEDEWAADVIQAVLMTAGRYVNRRRTPEGVFALGDFGSIRVATLDPDVRDLLAKYRVFRFSRSLADIEADETV